VFEIDHASREIFARLSANVEARGKHILFAGTREHFRFRKHLLKRFPDAEGRPLLMFADVDRALEWCENGILREKMVQTAPRAATKGCGDQYLCRGMTAEQLASLEQAARTVRFAAGESIFRAGDPASSFFFILSGQVDAFVTSETRREVRLSTLGPGSSFGELSLLNDGRRTAHVKAASDCECLEIPFEGLEEGVKTRLLLNLAGQLADRLGREAREVELLG
jgi:glutaminase